MPIASTFPSIAIPEKEKDKDWYTSFVRAICSNTFTDSWVTGYRTMQMMYEFFNFGTQGTSVAHLRTTPDGGAVPAMWLSANGLKSKLQSLQGELEERGYRIKARAINSEAFERKREEKERLRIKRRLQPVREAAEELAKLPLERAEYVPQTEEELTEFMDLTWKDKNVLILEAALKWITTKYNWDDKRAYLLRDIWISNRCVTAVEIIRGVPVPRRVEPWKFIFDPSATDDMLSDASYYGEVEYMPLGTAAERYGLTVEQLQECSNTYSEYLSNNTQYGEYFDCMPGQVLKWFQIENGIPKCLVLKACWRDYKYLDHKYEEKSEAKYLNDVTNNPREKGQNKDKIISNKIECWRQGTLVGGKFLRDWGECPNQPRELSSLEISEAPYKVLIPDFLNGRSVSKLEQLYNLQMLKDVALFQLQAQMSRAVGKVLVIDMAAMPEGMTKENAIGYLKSDGVVFVNSKEYELGSNNHNLFDDHDMGLSESIGQAISLIEYFDKQISQISGVSDERQGIVQGASQGLGVTNAAIFHNSLTTAPYFKAFERYNSRIFNYIAKLVKIAWADKEKFAPIIGDVGIDFLKDNVDISLDEFDVVIESLPANTTNRAEVNQLVMAAVQSDPEFLPYALQIFMEPDLTLAVRKFQRTYAHRQMVRQLQEQAQAEAEQAQAQEAIAAEMANSDADRQTTLQLQDRKNQGNMQKTLATSRTKLQAQKLDLLKP